MTAERRKLTTVDDPLAFDEPAAAASARVPSSPVPAPRELPALFVRLPVAEFDALARAAFELKVRKRELVTALVWRHVRVTPDGLEELRDLLDERRRLAR